MKKILVLVAAYPDNSGNVAMMYVHVRNKYYIKQGIDVTVLNFSTESDYELDGIKVISLHSYEMENNDYDVLLLHAANLRNHFKFLKKYEKRFNHLIFFYHGHEILKINKIYPKPYSYLKQNNPIKVILQTMYDNLKIFVWKKYLPTIKYKTDFVFVSNWIKNQFLKNTKLGNTDIVNKIHIINNSVGQVFEDNNYNEITPKNYDFITVRSNMDSSTYCIDLVNKLAFKYPNYKFLIIGKGKFYDYNQKPDNVTWINEYVSHEQLLDYINQSKVALQLTRNDTQGVMSCELATYGIPLITSDIEVCHEIFSDYNNVQLVDNNVDNINLEQCMNNFTCQTSIKKLYCTKDTIKKEIDLILEDY